MKLFHLISLTTLIVACGCADTHTVALDTARRPHTTYVEVFKDKAQPTKPAREIAELSWKGSSSDELKAQQYFMNEARKRGGNAVVIDKVATGDHLSFGIFGGLGGATRDTEFVYKAKVLVYE